MAFGIVCEYNPFHNGHLRQIQEIKKGTNEPIICVMSGNFTQRGEVSVADKYSRAKVALECGADLVVELPVPFCVASAEYFASASIHVLGGLLVDKLSFGSESANADQIINIAKIAASDEFKNDCANLSKNQGSAGAYFELLAKKSGVEDIKSNDILGIEYTKAIIKSGTDMQIFPIKREGNAYRDTELSFGELPSASAIREVLFGGDFDKISSFVPPSTMKMLTECELASIDNAKDSILLVLRLMNAENIDVAVSDKGLLNRILSMAHECTSFDEFEEKLQTKKYTKSAIRRAIFYILLGIKQDDLKKMPQYTVLLGATERGREYLATIRKNDGIIKVITKPSEADGTRQFELAKKADALFTMCLATTKDSGFYIKKPPVIL